MKPIPYGKQFITQQDIDCVIKALKSDYLTQGPKIEEFELNFADYIGSKYAIAVSNGTAALHLSALTLVNPGDKVLTTPITFVASANCVRYCGGEVVFADIDSDNYCLDINKVREILERDSEGKYKGIVPVDFAGYAVNLEEFRKLADEYGLWIIEDACHAPGGYFVDSQNENRFCGSGEFADLSVFSFHPVKHIACGEGGMITTNNEKLYKRILNLRTHGITKDSELLIENHGGWYYEMQELGYNYRLTDIQAALGNSQLSRADDGLKKRREIAQNYSDAFQGRGFVLGQSDYIEGHAYHLYILEVENRHKLYDYLRAKGIFAQIHYIPVHTMPYYISLGWKKNDMPVAESYYERCLSLPIYPGLTKSEQEYVIESIISFYE